MNEKKQSRLRRAKSTRLHIRALGATRLCVNRTPRHIYAQVISADGTTGNVEAATKVGALIAERAKAAGVTKVAFDRSGFKYHGRIKALADAARENGLEF